MKNLGFVVLAAAVSVAAMGCGGKDMPTDAQKARIQAVNASTDRAEKAIPATGTTTSPSTSTLALMSAAVNVSRTGNVSEFVRSVQRSISNADSDLGSQMSQKLQDSVTGGACSVSKTGLDGVTSGDVQASGNVNGSLSVTGDKCPVTFSLSVNTDMSSGTGGNVSFSISYSVKDEDYRKLNDVDSVSLKFSMSAQAGDSSASLNASIDGDTHSQQYGDVKLSGTGSGNFDRDGGSFEFTITEAFSDFSVDYGIKVEGSSGGSAQTTYSVNGNDVSQQDFNNYAGSLGGAGGEIQGGGLGPKT